MKKAPLIYWLACIVFTGIAFTGLGMGIFSESSYVFKRFHYADGSGLTPGAVIGCIFGVLGVLYSWYYWLTVSPEKNQKAVLSDFEDSPFFNYLGPVVTFIGFVLAWGFRFDF